MANNDISDGRYQSHSDSDGKVVDDAHANEKRQSHKHRTDRLESAQTGPGRRNDLDDKRDSTSHCARSTRSQSLRNTSSRSTRSSRSQLFKDDDSSSRGDHGDEEMNENGYLDIVNGNNEASMDGIDSFDDDSYSTNSRNSKSPCSSRSEKGKIGSKKSRLQYRCTNHLKEDHSQPIFCAKFNHDETVFATVGSNRLSIYQCLGYGKLQLMQAYSDPESDENLYGCCWLSDEVSAQPLIAIAGSRAIIRIINPVSMYSVKHFIGHGGAINELVMHPLNPQILLSASRDHTLRLWNVKTDVCVAIFGGVDGHRDEVLSTDFDLLGENIVSCGMDHSLKIWKMEHSQIKEAVQKSSHYSNVKAKKSFPTFVQHYPDFSTRDVHHNYVDCVRYFGQFILSKSCENAIICWKPGKLNENSLKSGVVTHLQKFDLRDCEIWYMRFSLDLYQTVLVVGTQSGRLMVWDMEEPSAARCVNLLHKKCTSAVRHAQLSKDGSIILAVCDDGTVWRWDITT